MTVLFDTQAYHRTLTDAGVPQGQADAHMRALAVALEGGLATKADVQALRSELKSDMQALRADLQLVEQKLDQKFEQRFAALDQKIGVMARDGKIWTAGVGVALLGAGLTVAKLLWN